MAGEVQSPTVESPARKPLKRILLRLARSLLIIYLGVTLGISMLQEKIIFPGQVSQGHPDAVIQPASGREIVNLQTSAGDKIAVLFSKAIKPNGDFREDAASCPTLVVFYGNGMCLADLVEIFRDWQKLGANVLGVEYPGYGMSSGKPGETQFYAAAHAAWEYLEKRPDIDNTRIIPLGISIGSAVAMELAHTRPAAGLIMLAPFTSLHDRARQMFPFLPTSLILRHRFDNHSKIGQLRIPITIIHGQNDTIVPVEMSHTLAGAATNTQAKLIIIETDHNDMFGDGAETINSEISQMIERVRGKQ